MKTYNQYRLSIRESGFVLLSSLMFLIVTTTLGVTILRMNTMDERMVTIFNERYECFQAAEAALKQGESALKSLSQTAGDTNLEGSENGSGPSKIYHRESAMIGNLRARDQAWWESNAVEFDTDMQGVDDPHYIIQRLYHISDGGEQELTGLSGKTSFYRVTARCKDRSDALGTEVILQSTFARPD